MSACVFVSSAVHATPLCHFSHFAAMVFEVYTPSEFGCFFCKVAFRRGQWPTQESIANEVTLELGGYLG